MGNLGCHSGCGIGVETLYPGQRRLIPYTSEIVCTLNVSGVGAKGGCILMSEDGKITVVDEDLPRVVGVDCNPAGTGIFGVSLNQLQKDVRSIFFVATLSKGKSNYSLLGIKQSDPKSFKGMTSGHAGLKCPGKELCTVALSPHTDGNAIVFLAIHKDPGGDSNLNSHRGGWCVEAVAKCYHCFNGDPYLALQPSLELLLERGLELRPTVMLGAPDDGICTSMGVPQMCYVEQDIRPPDEHMEVKPYTPRESAARPYASPSNSPRVGFSTDFPH